METGAVLKWASRFKQLVSKGYSLVAAESNLETAKGGRRSGVGGRHHGTIRMKLRFSARKAVTKSAEFGFATWDGKG